MHVENSGPTFLHCKIIKKAFLTSQFSYSYSDNNQRMSSQYMRYADDIDDSLKNRPHQMVKHCMLKKSLGESLDSTGIKV